MISAPLRIILADDEPLARERLRRLLRSEKEFQLVGEASDGVEAVSLIRQHGPQVALLDIRLPGLNGFEVLAALGNEAPPAVVFVTAHGEFARHAFNVQAADYLLKPFTTARFRQALERARARCGTNRTALLRSLRAAQAPNTGRVALKSGPRSVLYAFHEIVYAAAANTCCEVFTRTGSVKSRESLGSLEARLPHDQFVRISRFALVNLAHVAALEPKSNGDQHLFLRDNRRLTVARTRRSEVLSRIRAGLETGRAQTGLGRKTGIP